MASDVKLDMGPNADWIEVEAAALVAKVSDLVLDSPTRRTPHGSPYRRALVHNQSDGLTINFNGDYPGGVSVQGVAELVPHRTPGVPLLAVPALVVRGGITYEEMSPANPVERVTVSLSAELRRLNQQVAALSQRVAALEANR